MPPIRRATRSAPGNLRSPGYRALPYFAREPDPPCRWYLARSSALWEDAGDSDPERTRERLRELRQIRAGMFVSLSNGVEQFWAVVAGAGTDTGPTPLEQKYLALIASPFLDYRGYDVGSLIWFRGRNVRGVRAPDTMARLCGGPLDTGEAVAWPYA